MLFEPAQQISLGEGCYLDILQQTIVKDNNTIALPRIQFRLLYYLANNLGHPVTNEELIRYTWGTSYVCKEELYVYVNRIRQYLEDDVRKPRFLLNLRNFGYVLYHLRK